jgi:hypothetical protein
VEHDLPEIFDHPARVSPRSDCTASETSSTISQSASVNFARMAASLMPVIHESKKCRFKIPRRYSPYPPTGPRTAARRLRLTYLAKMGISASILRAIAKWLQLKLVIPIDFDIENR